MVTSTVFEAFDGTRFPSKLACQDYEKIKRWVSDIKLGDVFKSDSTSNRVLIGMNYKEEIIFLGLGAHFDKSNAFKSYNMSLEQTGYNQHFLSKKEAIQYLNDHNWYFHKNVTVDLS